MNRGNEFFTFVYGNSEIFIFVLLGIFLLVFLAVLSTARRTKAPLRRLPAYEHIRSAVSRAAELGKSVHFSPGSGDITPTTHPIETLAGLTVGEAVARQAAQSGAQLITTTNGAVTYALADNVTARGYANLGRLADYNPDDTRFITQSQTDALPYLVGAADVVEHENNEVNIAVGYFGPEYLLIGEPAARIGSTQIVGSSQPSAIPLMLATTAPENVLIGEEIFVAGAYLQQRRSHTASLVAQDALRLVIILVIIVGLILQFINPAWLDAIFAR